MYVGLLPSFIVDLQRNGDANFARRVISKLFDGQGSFRRDSNDHRYIGIPNAWIRYVSQGGSAFRVIYIQDGDRILVYRAGIHRIEDNLGAPALDADSVEVVEQSEEIPTGEDDLGRFICSLRTPYLMQIALARRLIPHEEVVFVSPFLSNSLLLRAGKIGRLLDDFIEDGTKVSLITRPPEREDFEFFADLECRGFDVLFHHRVHAKAYVFRVDRGRVPYGRSYDDLIVVGSANLTEKGFGASRDVGNEELCYEVPSSDWKQLETYVAFLALKSDDLAKVKLNSVRSRGKR